MIPEILKKGRTCGCGDCDNQEHLLDVMGGRPEPDKFAVLAEKIFYTCSHEEPEIGSCIDCITEALRAVDKEAYDRGRDISILEDRQRLLTEGEQRGLERAAEIVKLYGMQIVCGHIDHDDCQKKSLRVMLEQIADEIWRMSDKVV